MIDIKTAVAAIIRQGGDPHKYRLGLAERCGVAVEVIDAAIAAAGPLRQVDAETVAQERLLGERRMTATREYREWSHEE